MQPNTALSFWLCGVGLLAMVFDWRGLAAVSGVVVGAIGLLTFIQYMFAVDLGIDQFLLAIERTRQPGYPGRMAPTTALCFMMSGLALVAMSRALQHTYRPLLLCTCASVVTALALAILVAFATDTVDLQRWGRYIHMAVHTALGFIAIGVGIFAFAWHDGRAETHGLPTWLPMLVGIGVLTATLCAWQVLKTQERTSMKRIIESETASARSVTSTLIAGLDAQIHVLQRMARRWENAGKPLKEDWEFEALLNVRDFRGYQAIGWIDPTFHVRWLIPVEGNEGLHDMPLLPSERQRIELATMWHRRLVFVSHAIDLAQGNKGVMVFVPMLSGEDFGGFMLGLFSVPRLLDTILDERIGRGYSIAIFDEHEEIYGRHHAGKLHDLEWGHETTISLYGVVWRVRVWPTPETLAAMSNPLDEAALVTGLIIAALLAWLVHFAQVAARRVREAIAANRELARESTPQQRTRLEGVRVLVVDDTETNRKILPYQLEGWGMRHDSAADGPEALARLHREAAVGDPYTLVILDMQMPKMDGLQLAQAIKADPAITSARLLMMTSLGHRGDDRLIEEAGIMAFLTKPVKQSQLFDHLAMLIGGDASETASALDADRGKPLPLMRAALPSCQQQS